MTWAASKWFLQIRPRSTRKMSGLELTNYESAYTFHETRRDAVQALIDRESEAIRRNETALKRHKARLAAFIKKERQ